MGLFLPVWGLSLWRALRRHPAASGVLVWDGSGSSGKGAPSAGSPQPHPARVLWLRLKTVEAPRGSSGSSPMPWPPAHYRALARAIHLAVR